MTEQLTINAELWQRVLYQKLKDTLQPIKTVYYFAKKKKVTKVGNATW